MSGDHGCLSGRRTMKVNPGKTHTPASKHVTIDNIDLVGRVFGQSYKPSTLDGRSWSSTSGDSLTKSPFLPKQLGQRDFWGGILGYLSSAEVFLTNLFPTLECFSADEFLVGEFSKEEFSAYSSPAKGFLAEELPASIGTEPPIMSYFSA